MTQTSNSSLQGKNALVTGSGTGIGREVALELARRGANVVFHFGHSDHGANTGVEEAQQLAVKATAFQADFSDLDAVRRLGEQAIEFLGCLDILVNNAGITFNKAFFEYTPEQFDRLYSVNVRAPFFLTQMVAQRMIADGGGAICNITSIHGVVGASQHALYAGTKGAIIASTRALGVELAHQGVRVNAIAPGWVTVDNYYKAIPGFNNADAERKAREKLPIGRAGQPRDIAQLAAFLCSDEAQFIVGQTIIADGGTTALMSLMTDFRTRSNSQFGIQYM